MNTAFTSFPIFILNLASRKRKAQNFKYKTKYVTCAPFGGPVFQFIFKEGPKITSKKQDPVFTQL